MQYNPSYGVPNMPQNMPQNMQPPMQPAQQRREESFSSQATVFILKDKTWREQSQGLVQFVFDLNTYALRLIISPGQADEMDRRLRPRIRSKGPRAYVVRAQAPNNGEDSILAVRFEREEDSQNFRKFVEKRDADNTAPSNHQNNAKYSNQQPNQNFQAAPQYQQPNYPNNMNYPNVNQQMMGYGQPPPKYDSNYQYDSNRYGNYYPSPSPQGAYGSSHDYRATQSTMANPATTPHGSSQHQSLYSQGGHYNPNNQLVHRPTQSHGAGANWNPQPVPYGTAEGAPDPYGNQQQQQQQHETDYHQNGQNTQGHYQQSSANARGNVNMNHSSKATSDPTNQPTQPPANVNILKLTEANLEQHNRVFQEISMANKRKNVRDIILEQLQWQRDHGMPSH